MDAIEFLEKLRPGGPWVLTAIVPATRMTATITAYAATDVEAFIRENDGKKNLYYSVNPTRTAMTKKAAKTDIAFIEYLLSDLDPNEGESPEEAKARYLAALETHKPENTAIIDSGNGIQALWKLDERIELEEPLTIKNEDGETEIVFPEKTAKLIADVEARAKALMEILGSVAGTQNIDRILRLPGTINLPDAGKIKKGRVACPTKLIKFNGATCKLDDFPETAVEKKPEPINKPPPESKKISDIPKSLEASYLRFQNLGAGAQHGEYKSRSAVMFSFIMQCLWENVSEDTIAAACLNETYKGCAIYEHCQDNNGGDGGKKYVLRQIKKARKKKQDSGGQQQGPGAPPPPPGGGGPGTSGQGGAGAGPNPNIFELFWHGEKYDRPLREWLVKDLIFKNGTGLASGQWGTAKTFGVLDLSASVMTATPFAGREVVRQGGVLFVAAEGASEMPIRLQGVVERKLKPEADLAIAAGAEPPTANLDELPFAWIEDCPNLQNDDSFAKLMETVKAAGEAIKAKFDLPLVLIVIDTMSAVGNFKDADDAAEGQLVMNRLTELGRQSGAFVLVVDHFGKSVETGTRGSSTKEASVDVVLAWLADREINGAIRNTRMALRKLRGGQVGIETPFDLKVVNFDGETTCIIEWKARNKAGVPGAKDRWPKSLRIFQNVMETAIGKHGEIKRPHGQEGDEVRAVSYTKVRMEFMAAYPVGGDDLKANQKTKQKALERAMKDAKERELIGSREIDGIDYLWLAYQAEPEAAF